MGKPHSSKMNPFGVSGSYFLARVLGVSLSVQVIVACVL